MERSDPVFIPEWSKNNGNRKQDGGSSSLQSDDAALSESASKMSFLTVCDHKVGRLSGSVQPTSAYFRRSYNGNPSRFRSYSSSDRIRGEKGMCPNQDNDKYPYGSFRRRANSNPPDGTLPSKFSKNRLRRSQSMSTGKQTETWLRKETPESNNTSRSLHSNGGSIGRNGHSPTIPRNDPSLDVKEIGALKGEGIQLSGLSIAAVQGSQTNHESSGSTPSTTSLTTNETLARVPNSATSTQSPDGRQRLEELAIIQSRQLIPKTPSLPKLLFPSHTEKTKIKIMQQHYNIRANRTVCGGHLKSNAPKTSSVGKLLVLKPSREKNGEYRVVSPTEREDSSPIDPSGSRVNNSDGASSESKLTTMEKKPTSQARSRHDFFNLMKRKSSSNTQPLSLPENLDDVLVTSLDPVPGFSHQMITNVSLAAVPSHINEAPLPVYSVGESSVKAVDDIMCNECVCNGMDGNLNRDIDEKELAFLRSLGWEEPVEEDECLTEEEINAFFEMYMKLRPLEAIKFQQRTRCCSCSKFVV